METAQRSFKSAQEVLRELRRRLLQPSVETLTESSTALQAAVALLERGGNAIAPQRPGRKEAVDLHASVCKIRRELAAVTKLLDQAYRHSSFCARLISTELPPAAAYDADGNASGTACFPKQEARMVIHG